MNADLESFVPLTYSRRGVQRLATTSAVAHDTTFLVGLSRAFYWKSLLDTGEREFVRLFEADERSCESLVPRGEV